MGCETDKRRDENTMPLICCGVTVWNEERGKRNEHTKGNRAQWTQWEGTREKADKNWEKHTRKTNWPEPSKQGRSSDYKIVNKHLNGSMHLTCNGTTDRTAPRGENGVIAGSNWSEGVGNGSNMLHDSEPAEGPERWRSEDPMILKWQQKQNRLHG